MLYNESPQSHIDVIRGIENRADQCVEHFQLLSVPSHSAVWIVLSSTIAIIEEQQARFSTSSPEFQAAMLNLGRLCPMLIRWLKAKSPCQPPENWSPVWNPSLGRLAYADIATVNEYDGFQNSYPMWYRNRVHAELLDGSSVRFTVAGGRRERQVSAFHKGLRPLLGLHKAIPGKAVEPTEAILKRYQRILAEASAIEPFGFRYEHSYALARRSFNKYLQRLETFVRRSESLNLGGFTLKVFKRFYAALQAICAMHDYLCFCWTKWGHQFPHSSAVLVKGKNDWVKLLGSLASIETAVCERIIDDLTFYSKRLPDLHVYPFVPLNETRSTLAIVPKFVLNANVEENILRACSYHRPTAYDHLSNEKETVMRQTLDNELKRFRCEGPIALPDGSTDVDLVIEDEVSSTVVISELKWYRKPSTYRERLKADEQFLDGMNRQLKGVRSFCRDHPEFLMQRRALKRPLNEYKQVYFLLIARDHWIWFEPDNNTAVVDFEQFRGMIARGHSLQESVSQLLLYEWLPVENRDFHVRFDGRSVEGVRIESEVFYGGPPMPV